MLSLEGPRGWQFSEDGERTEKGKWGECHQGHLPYTGPSCHLCWYPLQDRQVGNLGIICQAGLASSVPSLCLYLLARQSCAWGAVSWSRPGIWRDSAGLPPRVAGEQPHPPGPIPPATRHSPLYSGHTAPSQPGAKQCIPYIAKGSHPSVFSWGPQPGEQGTRKGRGQAWEGLGPLPRPE